MEQSGFDDLFTSPASNPFAADGDNPFADIRSPAADPWASFYNPQPTPPGMGAGTMPAPTSPPASEARFASESPKVSPARPTFSSSSTSMDDHLPVPVHEEEPDDPTPPRTSTLSPPFREVYDDPTVPEPISPVVPDTPSTFSAQNDTVSSPYEPSYPTPVSSTFGEPAPLPTMASFSGLPDHTTYDSPLTASAFGNPFAPTTPLTASTTSSTFASAERDRRSTSDLLDSLGIADDSPGGSFAGPKFKPLPTPKKRVVKKAPVAPKVEAPPVPAVPPKEAAAPAAASVARKAEVTPPAALEKAAAPVATPVPPVSPPAKAEPPAPQPPVPTVTESAPTPAPVDITHALRTPLPPSEIPTPSTQTPVRVASPPAPVPVKSIAAVAEPLSPSSHSWSQPAHVAPPPAEPAFLSPLDAPSYRRIADRTISDLTLTGGMDDGGWGGVTSPAATTPGGWLAPGEGELLGNRAEEANGSEQAVGQQETQEEEEIPVTKVTRGPGGMKRRIDPNRPSINVTVGDPQKVGDPINAHIVYTVHTSTNSPNLFRKQSFSVLRRYSDFLWLYDTLSLSNPGVIVPPVPEKHSFGRFEETFVETRRQALNKCIQKIVDHPLLYTDPALKLFLESDSFAMDIKHRKNEAVNPATGGTGLMATIGSTLTGPKFIENDDWFENRKMYLDALESQFRGLIKAIDVVAKQRAEVVTAANELSQALSELAQSGLSKQLSHTIGMLADVEGRVKDLQEGQAKDDVMTFLAGIDEYTRLIGSIRLAFMSRERVYVAWQNAEADVRKVRAGHEKAKRQGKLPSDTTGVSLQQLGAAERRAIDSKNEFDSVTKLVKSEIARFEHERIEDFKDSLEMFLENTIRRQRELIAAWDQYQSILLKRLGQNPVANGAPPIAHS